MQINSDLSSLIQRQMPRILSQICRDPDSVCFGSWDRNFWHYKMRDFSSIILQQGGYLLLEAAKLEEFRDKADYFRNLAKASVGFWHSRAKKHGAFEEYYPFERSYPGLAFSTLAISKIIRDLKLDYRLYEAGLRKAIRQLESRTEYEASNQYLAGLAALYVLSDVAPDMVNKPLLDQRLTKLLGTQRKEGWFNEYGGPDLGYLSVSIDCLWDIFDVTGSEMILESIRMAITFIDSLLIAPQSIGLHNSRQTDYIVPYGILRMAYMNDDPAQAAAQRIAELLFAGISAAEHFLNAVDDRYWVHYIGHSVVRAYAWGSKLPLATENEVGFVTSRVERGASPKQEAALLLMQTGTSAILENLQDDASTFMHFPDAGYIVVKREQYSGLISTRKGGIVSIYGKEGQYAADYGSDLHLGRKIYVMNWWGSSELTSQDGDHLVIKGSFVPTREHIGSPSKHLILRFASMVFGTGIISILKNRLIFRKQTSPYSFAREIIMGEREITIEDRFKLEGLPNVETASRRLKVQTASCRLDQKTSSHPNITKAAAFSKRHVASADSYNPENASITTNCKIECTQEWIGHELQQTTIITL